MYLELSDCLIDIHRGVFALPPVLFFLLLKYFEDNKNTIYNVSSMVHATFVKNVLFFYIFFFVFFF